MSVGEKKPTGGGARGVRIVRKTTSEPPKGGTQNASGVTQKQPPKGGTPNVGRGTPNPTGGQVSPARAAAFDILTRVEEDGAYASILLADEHLKLSPLDRSLTYELVLGSVRWRSWLDAAIAHFSGRPLDKIDPPVMRALRMGLLQLRFLSRIPESAAVNESVNLMHRARKRSATGLVNAVLRRAIREPEFDPAAGMTDPIERLSVEMSHPVWLLQRWINTFGLEKARTLALANNRNPLVAFRFTHLATDQRTLLAELRGQGMNLHPSDITRDAWLAFDGANGLRELTRRGEIYLQDEASQWVANLAGASFRSLANGDLFLDACAAPGSKATLIADRLAPAGFVIAGDLHKRRIRSAIASAKRTGTTNIAGLLYNAEVSLPFREAAFSTVLVDAPCSGTGTLRRNPEIRWRISPTDIEELAQKQGRILANAARMVKPTGLLIYSTCSIEPDENEFVVRSFLENSPDFAGVDLREIIEESENPPDLVEAAPFQARFWPDKHGTEGFFVAAMKRIR
ncbi:MAG: 16S rRNA (cytosine(967)-C(5))-methyltransferase RsmB [Pyrinomonadaceae bacterium]